jgi:3-oxoadipate enol-lactonase
VREARSRTSRGTVVLSHALGCDASMWDTLANELAADHRVVSYDQRGHGGSDAPAGPYSLAELADDAARVIAATTDDPVVWIGVSMGGMVGQELALRHPQRVRALVIANSSGGYPPEAQALWQQRIETVQRGGMAAITDMVLGRYFAPAFHQQQPATIERFRRRLLATDTGGYIGCCHAVRGLDTLPRLAAVRVPVLVVAGELDQGTPVAMSQALVDAMRGARLHVLRGAAHISMIEQPAAFARVVQDFLDDLPSDIAEPS